MNKYTFRWVEETVFEGTVLAETKEEAEQLFEFDGQPIKQIGDDANAEIVKVEEVKE